MTAPDNPTLPKRLAEGSEAAFAELYERLSARLYRTAMTMLGREHDAQDALQQVFVGLMQSRQRLAGVRDLDAYVFASLRRCIFRMYAKAGRPAVSLEQAPAELSKADASGPGGDDRLARALAALPPEQREVIAMKIDAELTFEQIAATLEISPNTAASRYRYALEKLRTAMEARP